MNGFDMAMHDDITRCLAGAVFGATDVPINVGTLRIVQQRLAEYELEIARLQAQVRALQETLAMTGGRQ